jgi:hypothetical protein
MKHQTKIKLSFLFIVVFILFLLLSGCSGESEKDRLLSSIQELGESAEKKDTSGLLIYISDSYSDDDGRTFSDLEELLEEHFDRYRGIVVNILASEFIEFTPTQATVETDTAFSSGAAKMFRKLVKFSGQCYRFKLEFIKEDEQWKIKYASWRLIHLEDLYPESMKLFKKLFPKL